MPVRNVLYTGHNAKLSRHRDCIAALQHTIWLVLSQVELSFEQLSDRVDWNTD